MLENPGQPAEPLGGVTVLLADDEERLRAIVEMMLEELGATVIVAGDGASALRIFEDRAGSIDAALLDLRMRGLGGIAVFERLRGLRPQLPVLITSGATPDEDVLDRLVASGCGFIEKPFDIDGLAAGILAVMACHPLIQRSR